MACKTTKIGYLGPDQSTFGYQALDKTFRKGNSLSSGKPKPTPLLSHQEICRAVGNLEIKYGVVAVENSVDGVVAETVRAIQEVHAHLGIAICGEAVVPIDLVYMSKSGSDQLPKRLLSHQVAIGQCRNFVTNLQKRGVNIEIRQSTGIAAKEASQDATSAALAPRTALGVYNLKPITNDSVVDHRTSTTRFWILGKQHAKKQDGVIYKTSFLVNLEQDAKGVLYQTLGVFAKNNVSVLLQYPIPILGKKWEYTFLIEISGHVSDPEVVKAWNDFRDLGISLQPMQFLGSYPDATSD